MQISGEVLRVGDDIDTDVIYPARYMSLVDRSVQAQHLFEALGDDMAGKVARHPVLATGWNFGCGSSREHAVTALLGAGVRLVAGKSFARLFFRNAINNGLPVISCPELV